MDILKGVKWHRFVYRTLSFLFGWAIRLYTGFRYEKCDIKNKTFLLLANHTMDIDPLFCVIGTKRHMRFVASANILRGFGGWFVRNLAGPIPRYKGASADDTVALIEDNLRAGVSVAMFPEGNRTWDGETCYISPRTARLVRDSGAALVTYQITGGYFKAPRWSTILRRGPIEGHLVREYPPEELQQMSEDEIYAAICGDLAINAYTLQREKQAKYRCAKPAEGIGNILYLCPKCKSFSSFDAEGDRFRCIRCGLEGRYTETGFLEGSELPYDNILDWSHWQKNWIRENAERLRKSPQPISLDPGAQLWKTENGVRTLLQDNAGVFIHGDRIEVCNPEGLHDSFELAGISKLSPFRCTSVFFTCGDCYYELKFTNHVSGIKYFALWRVLTGQNYV